MSDGNESDIVPSRIVAKMGRLDSSDIGKGRKGGSEADSSSSRDSSPRRVQRHSFSSKSDDGDPVVPPIEDDDTPPPNAPILRQPVAFSRDIPASATHVDTYEAPAPSTLTANTTQFLPGQEVPTSISQVTQGSSRGTKVAKKKFKGRTRHYNDAFSDKTGSFRLMGYINDPNATQHDTRPNAQMYRASVTTGTSQAAGSQSTGSASSPSTQVSAGFMSMGNDGITSTAAYSPAAFHPGSSSSSTSSYPGNVFALNNALPTSTAASSAFHPGFSSSSMSSYPGNVSALNVRPAFLVTPHNRGMPSFVVGTTAYTSEVSRPRASSPRPRPKKSKQNPGSSSNRRNRERITSSPGTSQTSEQQVSQYSSSTTADTQISHYRRNYDRDINQPYSHTSTRSQPHGSSSHSPSLVETSSQAATARNPPSVPPAQSLNSNSQNTAASQSSNSVPAIQVTRMVTLLIEDVRSGTTDNQLAEVKVPLRSANDPEDGFWADAREISQALQSSPSRIDGPAKLYTLRGKYRQFFLRVSSDNVDETTSANLIVSKHRTLDIIVEALLPPDGALPPPPTAPRKLIRLPSSSAMHEFSPSPSATPQIESQDADPSGNHRKHSRSYSYSSECGSGADSGLRRGRPMSTASRSSGSTHHRSSGSHRSPLGKRPRKRGRRKADSSPESVGTNTNHIPMWIRMQAVPKREPSPLHDASPEEVNEAIWKAIQPSISEDEYWAAFMKLKAVPPPLNAPDMLKQYRFVQRKVNEWHGRLAPFKSCRLLVEKNHVLKALYLDERWGSECTETLDLIELYGPDGEHYEDQRVVEMMEDTSPPKGRPAKRLLRLLREIHENWMQRHQSENTVPQEQNSSAKGKEREIVSR